MPRVQARCFWSPLAAAVVLAACGGESPSLSEAVEAEVATSAITIPDGVDRFIAAQGTLCTETGGKYGDCFNLFGNQGPADVPLWCDVDRPTPLCWYSDLGVWERWVAAERGVGFGTRWSGQVTERRLSDGRRHVKVNLRGSDVLTFVVAMDVPGDDPIGIADYLYLGESPAELAAGVRSPTLGDVNVGYEFILPSDYEGYPDAIEFFYREWPAGFEFLSFRYTTAARGTARRSIEGIEAGETVKASVYVPFNYELAGKLPEQAVATSLRWTFFSPGYHVELRGVGN